MTPILKCKSLSKSYEAPHFLSLFSGIEFEIHPNETIAIVGRSGEGKSTLLHLLGMLDEPTSGEIELFGKKASYHDHHLRNQHIGFIFQQFHLLDDYTVLENVLMPASIGRKSTHKESPSYKRAEELLLKVGLKDRSHHFARQLSGGEKQRVAIARAFLNNPELILADEPSGNLDRSTAEQIHSLLLDFARNEGKACVIVTHDRELANLCQKQFVLTGGKLVNHFN